MRSTSWIAAALASAATLLAVTPADAENTRFFDLEGSGQFLDGNPESTAVTEDGTVALPPMVRERYADAAATFTAATARGDEVIVARSDGGKIVAVDRAGTTRTLYEADGTLVTALLATRDALFAAVGPPARIIRIDAKGKATTLDEPKAAFVWGMVEGPGDTILCVTGEPGTVLSINRKGKGTVLFAPDQKHMRSIYYDPKLGVFAGGGERGVLYRAADGKHFRALFDSGRSEITAVLTAGNYAYAASVEGADAVASSTGDEKEGGKSKGGKAVQSGLTQVAMDGSSQLLAGSTDEAIFALARDDRGRVLVATGATGRDDPRGRLYAVEPGQRQISMIYQSPSRRITHLVQLRRGALAAVAADGGRIADIAGGVASHGEFFTAPFDTGINSRFGNIELFGSWPKGTQVTAAVRSGETAEPDSSWSEWSPEVEAPGNARPAVENGRYVQVRLTLESSGKRSPEVVRLRLAYLRQNLAPFVREVVALRKGLALLPLPSEAQKSKTISLSEKPSGSTRDDAEDDGDKQRARQVEQRGALTIRWIADDPNDDEMRYDLDFRPLGATQWRSMGKRLEHPFYTLNSAQLPDGHYQFRVRATDAPSNPDGFALEDTRESRAVLVDNTAPVVDEPRVTVKGRRATVRVGAADTVGPFVAAEYALDGQSFRPLYPDDGVLDGKGESFTIRLDQLTPGPHDVSIRVEDEAGNEGVGEAHFSVR